MLLFSFVVFFVASYIAWAITSFLSPNGFNAIKVWKITLIHVIVNMWILWLRGSIFEELELIILILVPFFALMKVWDIKNILTVIKLTVVFMFINGWMFFILWMSLGLFWIK